MKKKISYLCVNSPSLPRDRRRETCWSSQRNRFRLDPQFGRRKRHLEWSRNCSAMRGMRRTFDRGRLSSAFNSVCLEKHFWTIFTVFGIQEVRDQPLHKVLPTVVHLRPRRFEIQAKLDAVLVAISLNSPSFKSTGELHSIDPHRSLTPKLNV